MKVGDRVVLVRMPEVGEVPLGTPLRGDLVGATGTVLVHHDYMRWITVQFDCLRRSALVTRSLVSRLADEQELAP